MSACCHSMYNKAILTSSTLLDRGPIATDTARHVSRTAFSSTSFRIHKHVPSLYSSGKVKREAFVISATANGDGFQDRARQTADMLKQKSAHVAKLLSEGASELFDSAKEQAFRFEKDNDLTGKAKRLFVVAGEKYDELGFEVKRSGERFDSKYKVSEKARIFANSLADKAQTVDERFRIKQKLNALATDIRLKMPTYQRRLKTFLDTPGGQFLGVCFLAWLALSGWLFRLAIWGLWMWPLLTLLLRVFVREAFVQGSCKFCGLPFAGPKSSVLSCNRCRQIVWQPGQTFNKNDPNIIDIEAE